MWLFLAFLDRERAAAVKVADHLNRSPPAAIPGVVGLYGAARRTLRAVATDAGRVCRDARLRGSFS